MKRLAALISVTLFLLTGCSLTPLSAAEKKYVDDCKVVKTNFTKYTKIQSQFESSSYDDPNFEWEFWPSGYPVTNAGQESRDAASRSIKKYFPWIFSLTEDYFNGISKQKFLSKSIDDWSSSELETKLKIDYYKMLANGTSFQISSDNLKVAEQKSEYFDESVFFGTLSPSKRFKNCDGALGLKGNNSFEALAYEYGIDTGSGVNLGTVLDVAIGIYGCETFGEGYFDYGKGWVKCASSDFDSSKLPTSTCTGQLKITVNGANYGDCGKLNFEIFQADKNTGGCLALGWWNDKNGVQQVGAFSFCGLEEGKSYSAVVTVGREYTYTNNFGTQKTVVGFISN